MRYFIILTLLAFTACKESAISKKLSKADKVEVRFTVSGSDIIEKIVTTDNENAIKKMIQLLDNSSAPQYKCGYDGQLIFFEKGKQLQTIDFRNTDKDCRHFSYMLDGKIVSTKMSNEANDLLTSLKQGKNFY